MHKPVRPQKLTLLSLIPFREKEEEDSDDKRHKGDKRD